MKLINLGEVVRDRVSGLIGTVIAKTEWLNGYTTCLIQPKVNEGGDMPKGKHIDMDRLTVQVGCVHECDNEQEK